MNRITDGMKALVTFKDELSRGLIIRPHEAEFLYEFYENLDDDWFERRETPFVFGSDWEVYEWLFKRAIAGYMPEVDEFAFMHEFEETPYYRAQLAFRYEQLKKFYPDELAHVFGTMDRRKRPQ